MSRRNFGAIRQRASGRWEARYKDRAGKTHYRYLRTKAEAAAFLATVEADMLQGDWMDPTRGQRPLGEWAEEWMAGKHDIRPRTRDLYNTLLRVHILPSLGATPVATITTEDIDAWVAALMADPNRGRTAASRALRLLASILGEAVKRRYIRFNPCDNARKPEEPPRREARAITPAQVADLADAVGCRYPQYRTLVLLAAYSGLRWGEAIGLGVGHVNLLRSNASSTRTDDWTSPSRRPVGAR